MKVTTYSQFSRSIHQRYLGRRAPLDVSVEVTRRCPLECRQCYNNLPMGDQTVRRQELSKDEHFRLLDELADMGCLWLLYTGGEIFARKDFLEIYTYAKKKGFLITLFTNGNLINEAVADYLAEWPPFAIEITLYGRTQETYEALTGVSGSYDRCLNAIALLRERGLPLQLKTVLTTINKHEASAMRCFAEEELHLDFKFDSIINPRIDCSQAPLSVRLSPEEVVALDLTVPKVAAEYRGMAERDCQRPPALSYDDNLYCCGGGMKSFSIDPYGRMSICVLSQQHIQDTRQSSVKQVWEEFLLRVRTQKRQRPTKCVHCRLQSICGMCPALGELENGDAERPIEFLCEVAHLRAITLGVSVPDHGDCEYCLEGRHNARLRESAQRIVRKQINLGGCASTKGPLPVFNDSNGDVAGCGTCEASQAD